LTPVVAYGTGVRTGYLYSPATRRTGLTATTDIAPTILHDLGIVQPKGMVGSPLQYERGPVDFGRLQALDRAASSREEVYSAMTVAFITAQAVGYGVLLVLLLQRAYRRRSTGVLRFATLVFAAWPVSTFLLRALPPVIGEGPASQTTVWILAAGLAFLADRWRTDALAPLTRLCGLTVVVVLVDLALGGNLQQLTVLGYSPHTAARYTGIGNMAFGAFAGAAVLWGLLRVERAGSRRRGQALLVAAIIFGLVTVVDGWPTLGSKVGSMPTLVPVLGLAWLAASGRRIRWRTVALVGLITAAALAGATAVDLLRPADQRTHLGRFAASLFDGNGEAWTTISRKATTNLRVLQNSNWALLVPVVAIFSYGLLSAHSGAARLVPRRSLRRIALVAVAAVGVLGGLVNDSGVVLTALALVYVGPFLTLLAVDRVEPPQQLLEPLLEP